MLFFSLEKAKEIFVLKILIVLTFVGHACFALGLHYVPENFLQMTQGILLLSSENAYLYLFTAGVLDILCAFLLFANGRVKILALYYLIGWGFLTALARFVYPFSLEEVSFGVFFNGFLGMVYRLPHALIPLLVY